MDPPQQAALEYMIRRHAGAHARFFLYDRSEPNRMTFVLDLAERRLNTIVHLYWITEGLPEIFCLTGFPVAAVGFGDRYLLLANRTRALMSDPLLEGARAQMAERICLKMMAEFALAQGDLDLAVSALAASALGQTLMLPDWRLLLIDLSDAPSYEQVVALWYFGILHELGHFAPVPADATASDDNLRRAVAGALARLLWPDETKRRALDATASGSPGHVLRLATLRTEISADLYAVRLMLEATQELMRREGLTFRPSQFAMEVIIFFRTLMLIHRCRQTAMAARRRDREALENIDFAQLAFSVRLAFVRGFLQTYVYSQLVNVDSVLVPLIQELDPGLGRAMGFALVPEKRDPHLLERFIHEAASNGVHQMEIEDFLAVARSFAAASTELGRLRSVVHGAPGGV